MRYFLETQGPWEQLVQLKQIELRRIAASTPVRLNARLSVTPLLVPHRDEYSETVAFRIDGPNHSVLYLPDIDKWDRWEVPIEDLIAEVDLALLDATFFDGHELPGRDMTLIPHPFVVESLELFSKLSVTDRDKIHFIHLNHTNPALQAGSPARRAIEAARCHVAEQGDTHSL
jgi:pyrroloquinoline quinone biosynthesis protein B